MFTTYQLSVTTPQDDHKSLSAAGVYLVQHFRVQCYVGKSFVSIVGFV